MTNHQRGHYRDRQVLETIAEWGTMDTEQLRLLFYPSSRVAQRRLKILSAKGRLKRHRDAIELPYAYSVQKHDLTRLALNWARIWLLKRLKSWDVLDSFDYATNTATIRNIGRNNEVRTVNVLYNVKRKTWISGEAIIVYDTDDQKREASRQIKSGTLLTIDEIREGLKCEKSV